MNLHMEMDSTPEGRIAGKVMAIIRHLKWERPNDIPDHADFKDGLKNIVTRELIIAKVEALKVPKILQDAERQRLVRELGELQP